MGSGGKDSSGGGGDGKKPRRLIIDDDDEEDGLPEPSLIGSTRELRGDKAYPSNNPSEFLSDAHLVNAHASDERPEGLTPVLYNQPRPFDHVNKRVAVTSIFTQENVQRVLNEKKGVLIQTFCRNLHWCACPCLECMFMLTRVYAFATHTHAHGNAR